MMKKNCQIKARIIDFSQLNKCRLTVFTDEEDLYLFTLKKKRNNELQLKFIF